MLASSAIGLTHEHPGHIAGVALEARGHARERPAAHDEGTGRLRARRVEDRLHEGSGGALRPIAYGKLFRVAPGVALQRAPGHSPGSRLIYVRRADGKELLFVGDILAELGSGLCSHCRFSSTR